MKDQGESASNGGWRKEVRFVDAVWDVAGKTNFPLEMENKHENWTHKANSES